MDTLPLTTQPPRAARRGASRAAACQAQRLARARHLTRLLPSLLLLVIACALAACDTRYSPAPPTPTAAPPATSRARVFDAGDKPHPIWDEVRVGWTQQLTWHPHLDGQPWAARAEVEVLESLPDGAWRVEQRILAAMPTTEGAPTPPPFSPDSLRQQWTFTPNGPLPALPTDKLPAPLIDLHSQLQQLALQLPADPIGEGAFWDVSLSDSLSVGVVLEARTEDEARVRVDWPADPTLPTVRLLWGGQEPRQPLRYKPAVGQAQAAEVTLQDATTRTDTRAAVALPTSRSTLTVRVTEQTPDSVRFTAEVTSEAHPEPFTSSGTLRLGQGVEPAAAPAHDSATSTVSTPTWAAANGEQWVVALPREPVGVGARWAVRSPISAGPWQLQRLAVYTLERVEGDTLTLRVDAKQTAADLALSIQGPRKPLPATLLALDADERGTLTLDLTRLIPAADIALDVRLWVTPNSGERPTLTHTTARLTISPATAPAPAPAPAP